MGLVFVDTEAEGPCPGLGRMSEFGAVTFPERKTFHGVLFEAHPDPANPTKSKIVEGGRVYNPVEVYTAFSTWLFNNTKGRAIFVSDNPAYDWQWINDGFWRAIGSNPFGHSARRLSDYYAGLRGDFFNTQEWKSLRITKHTHHPVDDAMGNLEAFERMTLGERGERRH